MKKKIISIFVCMLLFATASSVAGTLNNEKSEVANDVSSITLTSGILSAPGDFLFDYDVQTPTGDNQCLGVEYDGTNFWVTGGGAGGDNWLYKFDSDGNYLTNFSQGTVSSWGWRDLAWDGTYLYGSDEDEFVKIDPADGSVVELLTKPAGLAVCRALAVNTDDGHFFTANWGSPIYEFDPSDGSIFNTFGNPDGLSIYGMAYDDVSAGGPYLWVFSQDGVNPILVQISQFDIAAGIFTGLTYEGYYDTEGMAGGACFIEDWDGTPAFVGLTQGTPVDLIFGMEIGAQAEIAIGAVSGGLLKVKAEIDNIGTADATGVMWEIKLTGGLILLGKTTSGGPVNIAASGQIIAQSSLILGFGKPVITVTADTATKDVNATVLLFFIIIP